jgi:hypothetical protein
MSDTSPTPPPAAGGGDLIYPPQPPKDPVIIMVLNLLIAGCVGYFVMGQKMKGIIALILYIVCAPFTCFVGSLVVAVFAAIDGWMQAQQLQAGFPIAQWTFFKDHR